VPKRTDSRLAKSSTTRKGEPGSGFELLRPKLEVPSPRPGLVERTGVVDRLSRGRGGRFVSVVAPPGYGKTTALAQWAARDSRQFAWVSLDHRDNDPAILLTYVAEALNVDGTVGPAVFKALTGPSDSLWASGLPRLGSALAARREALVLVLDDVHELENHDCLDALLALFPYVPQGSQLVLSGRTEARLGLAKLRADGELLELGPSALALNDTEAHALLGAAGLDVTESEAAALNEHVEGWAAGLYLAALSTDGDGSSLASFGGDDRFVTDYLRSEELARVGQAELEFLLQTAILDRMCGPLCDAGARAA
jgi:LuxR family transcriptional regulator, maltose regulon positive regulatory protein